MPAWPFQAAHKCGPSLLPPLGMSMHPRHQEDGGQPSPGHFMYLVYPMLQHMLLHALTIPCVSPDPMDASQVLHKSPGSCSLHKMMIKVISLTYFTSLQRNSMLVLLHWLGRVVFQDPPTLPPYEFTEAPNMVVFGVRCISHMVKEDKPGMGTIHAPNLQSIILSNTEGMLKALMATYFSTLWQLTTSLSNKV